MGPDLDIRWVDGALHLSGEMDLANADRLDEAVSPGRPAETALILDLSEIGFMDSSACLAILRVFRAHAPTEMVLRDPSPAARRVLDLLPVEEAGVSIVTGAGASVASSASSTSGGPAVRP